MYQIFLRDHVRFEIVLVFIITWDMGSHRSYSYSFDIIKIKIIMPPKLFSINNIFIKQSLKYPYILSV